jgi:succinyl-CoA synthetase alpha subunit
MIKTIVKKGVYYDSVTLMNIAKKLKEFKGIEDLAVVMATQENKSIIKTSGLHNKEIDLASDNDLAITVKANDLKVLEHALKSAEEMLKNKNKSSQANKMKAHNLNSALEILPDANMAIISVAGRYAGNLAMECLKKNLNVMIFSDNVDIETEIELKKIALKKGLLVMGPDCGTAIINGIPLAFANSIRKGNIAIVAASGTGLQEVSCIISNEGAGISQAIGTGSRDVKREVSGQSMISGLQMLSRDKDTDVIVLVSKPPHPEVLKKIAGEIKKIKKPVVSVFLGGELKIPAKKNFINAVTLEQAALKAVSIACGQNLQETEKQNFGTVVAPTAPSEAMPTTNSEIEKIALSQTKNKNKTQKWLRGLFSGGTFVSEAQIILKDFISPIWSNAPVVDKWKLKNPLNLKNHSIIDLGADEFTQGRLHPMIDYSMRNSLIISQSKNNDVSVILLDVVLGYGSNPQPLKDILPAIKTALKNNRGLSIITSVTGTETDPQVRSKVMHGLENAGVIVLPSNAAACRLAGRVVTRA